MHKKEKYCYKPIYCRIDSRDLTIKLFQKILYRLNNHKKKTQQIQFLTK